MSRSPPPRIALLGLLLFLVLGISLQPFNLIFGTAFSQVFVFFCIPWISCRFFGRAPGAALGLKAISPKKPAAGALLGIVSYVAWVLPLMHGVKQLAPPSWEMVDIRALLGGLGEVEAVLMALLVLCIAPLCEEVFFRGFLQPQLIARWGVATGLVVSALLFSLIHLEPLGFFARLALGLLFGWLAYASANLWVSIAAHAAYNLLNLCLLMLFFYEGENTSLAALSPAAWAVWLALGALAMAALCRVLGFWPPFNAREATPPSDAPLPPLLLRHLLRPWLLAAAGSCLLLVAVDYRGIALGVFDTAVAPLSRAARENPAQQEALAHMQALRKKARAGQVALGTYFEFRKRLTHPTTPAEPGEPTQRGE